MKKRRQIKLSLAQPVGCVISETKRYHSQNVLFCRHTPENTMLRYRSVSQFLSSYFHVIGCLLDSVCAWQLGDIFPSSVSVVWTPWPRPRPPVRNKKQNQYDGDSRRVWQHHREREHISFLSVKPDLLIFVTNLKVHKEAFCVIIAKYKDTHYWCVQPLAAPLNST